MEEDYLVGNTVAELDKAILDKVVSFQKLLDEDKTGIMCSIDGLIQHAKTRVAYKCQKPNCSDFWITQCSR